jgi:hypothetical protein
VRVEVRAVQSRGVEGEPLALEIRLRRRLPLPTPGVALCLERGDGTTAAFALSHGVTVGFTPVRRGQFPLRGGASIRCDWPFGLWGACVPAHVSRVAIVRPLAMDLPAARAAAGGVADRFSRQAVPAASGEPAGLREYRRGDSARQIHWAATARLGRLVTTERVEPAARAFRVRIDASSFATPRDAHHSDACGDAWEHAIRAAAGCAAACVAGGRTAEVRVGDHAWTVDDSVALGRLLDGLGTLPACPGRVGLRAAHRSEADLVLAAASPAGSAHDAPLLLAAGRWDNAAGTTPATGVPIRSVEALRSAVAARMASSHVRRGTRATGVWRAR